MYNKESEAAFRREVDRSMQSMEAFVHNKVSSLSISTDTPNDDDILVWDDATGLWVPEAPTADRLVLSDYLTANVSATADTAYNTGLSVTVTQTGFYSVWGMLRAYTTSTADLLYRFIYKSSATGYITTDWATELIVPITEGGTTGQIDYTASGIRVLQMGGYIDVTSVASNNTFDVEFKRWSGTTGTCYLGIGSHVILTRLGDT
jgi:hypothetical protein